ncbi:MAG: hypothetical protein NTZ33_07885 [Bacteroidetes bacterium]|nr:hypothetical protein [Bacteroidota bacterium]
MLDINYIQAQNTKGNDTVALKKGDEIKIGKKIIRAYSDTTVFVSKKKSYKIRYNNDIKSAQFYDSLKVKSARNPITKSLYEIFVTSEIRDSASESATTKQSELEYKHFKGRKIRNITIKRLEPFGTSVRDTSLNPDSWFAIAGNDIHIRTFEKVVQGNLLIKKGDVLNPYLLAENERILRNLPYMYDAKIYVNKAKDDSVDVFIVTRDLFSIGIKPDLGSRAGSMELYDLNFIGFGNELNNKLFYDIDSSQHYGYRGEYKINNIKRSFINGGIFYESMYDIEKYGIYINRDFVTSLTKYAGGISTTQTNEVIRQLTLNQNNYNQELNFNKTDFWIGRSFALSKEQKYTNSLRFIISARYLRTHFNERPDVAPEINKIYHQSDLLYGKIALSKRNYYKSNLIYAFGNTEDIPYGYLMEFTTGAENREFSKRTYYGWEISAANMFENIGYIYAQIGFGGYNNRNKLEQSTLRFTVNTFSNLYFHNRYKFRNFFHLNYVMGINRFAGEFITLDPSIKDMQSAFLLGTQKLSAKMESVAFTPANFYGFKIALYGFWDIGVIGSGEHFILTEKYFLGIGAGLRIRNDNLVFQTFQLNIGYYPILPNGKSTFVFSISGQDILKLFDFISKAPSEVAFQ